MTVDENRFASLQTKERESVWVDLRELIVGCESDDVRWRNKHAAYFCIQAHKECTINSA